MNHSVPDRGPRDRIAPGFGRRLAYYLLGIAIGLLLLGFFQQMRSASHQRQLSQPGESSGSEETAPAGPASGTRTPGEQTGDSDD